MTAEIGLFFLILALLIAILQAAALLPCHNLQALVLPCLRPAAWLQALCITLAFALLISLRLDSDFSVTTVIANSNLSLPALYKITGSWGNHEGSMVLWVWVLALFGAVLAGAEVGGGIIEESNLSSGISPTSITRIAVAVQAFIGAGFLLFILFTSNPFARRFPPTTDGEALNPLLQDVALAMHPPLLYLGYVGFSLVFSLAVAALIQGKLERSWAARAHPWILASWSALTLGIGLGSWWAYRVLGWGGWWFWDPVENASLLPWLSGTALLHANMVLKKRGLLGQWVLLLAILTFGLSLLGTFLVRSGVLNSVHSFASDPMRGLFILGYMATVLGGALLLYALRVGRMGMPGHMLPGSREGMIIVNNLFLLTACATVLLGTLYPLLAEWFGDTRLTVGPPYFNATFLPLMSVPIVFAGLAPLLAWKKARLRQFARAWPSAAAALAGGLIVWTLAGSNLPLALLGFLLAFWLAGASIQALWRARGRKNAWPLFFAHFGAALLVAGITGGAAGKMESDHWLKPGDTVDIAGYRLTYQDEHTLEAPNYHARRGTFLLSTTNGRYLATLTPEYRTYAIRNSATSEAAIHYSGIDDIYVVIGEPSPDGSHTAMRAYYTPMIGLIWLGFVLMAGGGMFALFVQQRKNRADYQLRRPA